MSSLWLLFILMLIVIQLVVANFTLLRIEDVIEKRNSNGNQPK